MTNITFKNAKADNNGTADLYFSTTLTKDEMYDAIRVLEDNRVYTGWDFCEMSQTGYINVDMSLAGDADDFDNEEDYVAMLQEGCEWIASDFGVEFTGKVLYDAVECLEEEKWNAKDYLDKIESDSAEKRYNIAMADFANRILDYKTDIKNQLERIADYSKGKNLPYTFKDAPADKIEILIGRVRKGIERANENIANVEDLMATRTVDTYAVWYNRDLASAKHNYNNAVERLAEYTK